LDITLLTNGDVTISIDDPGFIGIVDIGDTTIEYLKGLMNDYKNISSFYNNLKNIDAKFANELFTKIPLSTK
jgi:hypothetical protein